MEDAQRQILTLLQERGYDRALDRHLLLEQLCLEVLNVHARSWQALQRNIAPGVNDVTSGNALVELSQQQLDGVLALLDAQHISESSHSSPAHTLIWRQACPRENICDATSPTASGG
jgi:hypothetical protein